MTDPHTEEIEPGGEMIDGLDVDHLTDRPDRLEHVGIKETPDGDLRALPFNESDTPIPGYTEIDVDLMEYQEVCQYVETHTDHDRRIDFTRAPAWPPEGPTATRPDHHGRL